MPEHVTFGVYVHSSGPQGGYVARTQYNGVAPNPYNTATAVAVYKTLRGAEKACDRLNGYSSGEEN